MSRKTPMRCQWNYDKVCTWPTKMIGQSKLTMERSLVRLHQYILKRPCTPGHPEAKVQEQSHATLDTLARMMIEVAYDHVERFVPSKIDSLPLSCSYNMRSMMELIEDRWGQISSKQPPKGLEAFAALHKAVCKRWRCSLEH
jgi:hypothetical protein